MIRKDGLRTEGAEAVLLNGFWVTKFEGKLARKLETPSSSEVLNIKLYVKSHSSQCAQFRRLQLGGPGYF